VLRSFISAAILTQEISMTLPNGANVSSGQVGQPAQASQQVENPAGAGAQQQVSQQFVTVEQVESIASRAAENAYQKALQSAQSMQDKASDRVRKEVEQRFAAAGINATPEQVQKYIDSQQQQSQQAASQASNAQLGQTVSQPANDPVVNKALQIAQEKGVTFEKDDPEMEMIDKSTDDPEVFLASVRKAADAKAVRVGSVGNPARMPVTTNGSHSNQPLHAGLNGTDTLDSYFDKKF
jgi:hypothetical protein